jgi:regulator of protease activity HflC (stomatin/prohibitin superfamily)
MGALVKMLSITGLSFVALATLTLGTGCAGVAIQPGHRALYFDPNNGGIQHEVLQPGWYRTACPIWEPDNKCPRVDDFDVTYTTSKEDLHVLSSEGLPLDLHIAVSYRPIVAELYMLDTEIGANYFDEVIGPEFRSAAIGVFAKTSYQDLQRKNGAIEDEIEKALRERLGGKHVEISSVLIQKVDYAPEILKSEKERVVSQEETLKKKQLLANQAETEKMELETHSAQKKMELEAQTAQKKMELEAQATQQKLAATTDLEVKKIEIQKDTDEEKFRIDSSMRNKQAEAKLTVEQARIDKMKADAESVTRVTKANGEASARIALARASAAEGQAESASVTPMQVEMHAYDALGKMGGSGTSIMLGDWSKLPAWLFPKTPGFQSAFSPVYALPPPTLTLGGPVPAPAAAPASTATLTQTNGNPYP